MGSSSDEEDDAHRGKGKNTNHREGSKEGSKEGNNQKKQTALGRYNLTNNVSALSLPSAFRQSQEVVAEHARVEEEQKRVAKRWRRMQVTPLSQSYILPLGAPPHNRAIYYP